MPLEDGHVRVILVGEVPDPDGPVPAARGQVSAGGRERQPVDRVRVGRGGERLGSRLGAVREAEGQVARDPLVQARQSVDQDLPAGAEHAVSGHRDEPLALSIRDRRHRQGKHQPTRAADLRPQRPLEPGRPPAKLPGVDDLVQATGEQVLPIRTEREGSQRGGMPLTVRHQDRIDEVLGKGRRLPKGGPRDEPGRQEHRRSGEEAPPRPACGSRLSPARTPRAGPTNPIGAFHGEPQFDFAFRRRARLIPSIQFTLGPFGPSTFHCAAGR